MNKKSRLFFLALSVFLPPICIMLLAATDLLYSLQNVETLARSYVENFTENLVERIETGNGTYLTEAPGPYEDMFGKFGALSYAGLGRLPVLIALQNRDGNMAYGSDRLLNLLKHSGPALPIGAAEEIYDVNGERFTVAAYPSTHHAGFTLIGAISWRDLPGSTLRTLYLWPALMACFAIWSGMVVWRLWWRVMIPISELQNELSSLKWGEELLKESSTSMIHELGEVRQAIAQMALDAIEKVSIIRICTRDIVSVEENERTNISREIHDGALQDVTALLQRVHLANLPDNTAEETKQQLTLAEKIGQSVVKEMRAVCDFLTPPWLDLGLEQALTELSDRLALQYGLTIHLDIDEEIEFSEPEVLSIFRVVQEALTNSAKHGNAKNIWVEVKSTEEGPEFSILDDGQGFMMHEKGTSGLRVEGHRGLSNMEERMMLIGGHLEISSFPGKGTCIRGILH